MVNYIKLLCQFKRLSRHVCEFNCPAGLRQGCTLSPLQFALLINELYDLLCATNIRGLHLFPDINESFLLRFADDIALVADTVVSLKWQLSALNQIYIDSKLQVNVAKTKILVFKRDENISFREKLTFANVPLEIINGFTYLGLYFSNRISLYKMSDCMATKAKMALVNFKFIP